jgi:hypothetical protein
MSALHNEFDILKQNLPLKDNLSRYLLVKTKVKYADDLEFRLATGLDTMISKFGHSGWREMKPLIVGIKCCMNSEGAFVYVRHSNREQTDMEIIDSFEVANEEWYTFKYPLLANYHTETRIILSPGTASYTLAILNTSEIVRNDNGTNYFPSGYASFDTNVYGSFNKALVYCDEKNTLILPPADLNNAVVVKMV